MVNEEMLLHYFYKQDRLITIADLFDKYGVDASILKPINYLVNFDWLKEDQKDSTAWTITEDGKAEYERRQRSKETQPAHLITIQGNGNVINTGLVKGNIKTNIKALDQVGLCHISKAINDLTESVIAANEIKEHQKNEYLETLMLLSEEALKPKEKRLPNGTIKQIIQFGLGTLTTFSSISTIAGINLKDIADYFLK